MSRGPGRAAVIAAALLALLAGAAPAHAGVFRVSQCNAVDQGGLAARAIQADLWRTWNGWPISTCGAPGGALRFDAPDHRLAHYGELIAEAAVPASMPATSLRGAWLDWRSPAQAPSTNPAYVIATAAGTVLFDVPSGSGTPPGAAQWLRLPAGARELRLSTWCSPVNGPGWCNWPSQLLEVRGLTFELEESREPSGAASGPLTEERAHAGTVPLRIEAADADSGVRHVAVALGGVTVGEAAGECRDDRLPTCPPALRRTLDVTTARVPDGEHRLRLVVTDAAANARTVDAGTVLVRNGPPALGTGGGATPASPHAGAVHAAERAIVRAWLEPRRGARRRLVTTAYGRRVRVRGRVLDAAGRPLGGASLVRFERERGRPVRISTGVRTRADGRFTAFTRIGPSRTLHFAYRPIPGSPHVGRSRTLRVAVRAPVWIRAWAGGGVVRVRGRLGGGRVPRGGALVELQRLLYGRWTGVGALRTRGDGRFAARVSARSGGAARLRALVPAQPGLPFAAGRSRGVSAR